MARRVVIGELRVQRIDRDGGRRSWTIVWPDGREHSEADRFLREHDGAGAQRTYAYLLVDHLRWMDRECLALDRVGLRDLQRYMGLLGAEVRMPLGAVAGRETPVRACGTVNYGFLLEGLLSAPRRSRCEHGARQGA